MKLIRFRKREQKANCRFKTNLGINETNKSMKIVKIIFFLSILFLIQFQIKAQQTAYYENVQKDIEVAKQLFDNGKYVASYIEFEKIQQSVENKSELYSEAEYYKAVAALNAGYNSGSKLIKNFVKKYGESPYINSANF